VDAAEELHGQISEAHRRSARDRRRPQLQEDSELHRPDRQEPKYNRAEAFDFALSSVIDGLRLRLRLEGTAGGANARKRTAATASARKRA
jgi:hypothetical protein